MMYTVPARPWTRCASDRGSMQRQIWRRLLARPVWLLAAGVAVLLLLGFGLLFYSSLRHDVQLRPLQAHLRYLSALEDLDTRLRASAAAGSENAATPQAEDIDRILGSLIASSEQAHFRSDTPLRLAAVARELRPGGSRGGLSRAQQQLREVIAGEVAAHSDYLEQSRQNAERELRITLGILVGLLLFTIPLGIAVRRRILAPLDNLGHLMTLLSKHDYASADLAGVDPMLRPLYVNYNRMVSRLASLEQDHQKREDTLTDSVRRATRLLLQQHRRLAQAERLGAVGEVAASVAHELRNPLASMYMALQNLRGDIEDRDHTERIDMVIAEINRMSQQLNLLLDSARQMPEALAPVDVAETLNDLVALVRYQLPEQITLELTVEAGCICRLPEARFRQSTLNLIINAGQMLEDRAGHIHVDGRMAEGSFVLTVEDDGPGFPQQLLVTGAQPFGSWRTGGTGLGLVMVRRFVNDLGGTMRIENHNRGGAKVTLFLPCGAADHG